MAYGGTTVVNAGFTQSRGDFPIVDAKDVYVDDTKNLDGVLGALSSKTYDFSKNADIIKAVGDIVRVFGATVNNDPTAVQS